MTPTDVFQSTQKIHSLFLVQNMHFLINMTFILSNTLLDLSLLNPHTRCIQFNEATEFGYIEENVGNCITIIAASKNW